jgi:flagellar biosynthesis protein FliQ
MSLGSIVSIIRGSIFEIMILSAPVLIVALVVGLIVAIFQATTSIQEQTLTFVPKIMAILGVLALLGSWMFAQLREYTITLFQLIPQMVR